VREVRAPRAARDLLILALVLDPAKARAQSNDYDIRGGTRMAVTDRSTTSDLQPRVWALAYGSVLGPRLVTKIADQAWWAWQEPGLDGIHSGLDAVSFTDGTHQRQRIFFAYSGFIAYLSYDNDVLGSWSSLPYPAGYTFPTGDFTDVAAVTWLDGSTRRIAVLAGARKNGQPG